MENRFLKFRVWMPSMNRMSYKTGLSFCENEIKPIHDEIFMQHIGMKDKDGKDIFEHDIVERWSNHYIVIYDESQSCFRLKWIREDSVRRFPNSECKVIGNIYEHKHLIEV